MFLMNEYIDGMFDVNILRSKSSNALKPVPRNSYDFSILDFSIFTLSTGRSDLSVSTKPMRLTTCIPEWTRPNIVCFLSSHWVGASVMKNCEPFESGPELAIERMPAPLCFRSGWISSGNDGP